MSDYNPEKVNFLFPARKKYKEAGYTLVEMSIVLVIIGVLVGATIAGSELIHTTELKTIVTEGNSYKVAIRNFQDKYSALPGDMSNATTYWGAAHATPATCAALTTASTNDMTCNGNGDGRIAPVTSTFDAGTEDYESFRAWQQMHSAGMLNMRVSGVRGGGGTRHAVVGTNIPTSRFSDGSGWSLFYLPYSDTTSGNCINITGAGSFSQKFCRLTTDNNWIATQQNYENVLLLGGNHNSVYAEAPIISASDAYNIDSKFDDGLPATGELRAVGDYAGSSGATTPDCTERADPTGSGYITNMGYLSKGSDIACSLMMLIPPRQ